MDRPSLGRFEEIVLKGTLRLRERAYPANIRHELWTVTGKDYSIGSVFNALERMEAKGFVKSHKGEPIPERGGRSRRYFTIEALGQRALDETDAIRDRLAAAPLLSGA
jgi:PadR family transcriptional regulator PadR